MTSSIKFLIDEDVPVKLLRVLRAAGHDAIRVEPSSSDSSIARQAKNEGRVLITLDKDFTNTALYPPSQCSIVHVRIHPPHADAIVEAARRLLSTASPEKLRGLIVLESGGSIRISE